jgi:hypothetical protein
MEQNLGSWQINGVYYVKGKRLEINCPNGHKCLKYKFIREEDYPQISQFKSYLSCLLYYNTVRIIHYHRIKNWPSDWAHLGSNFHVVQKSFKSASDFLSSYRFVLKICFMTMWNNNRTKRDGVTGA